MRTISWWRTDYIEDDIARIAKAVRSKHVSMGAVTAEFERNITEKLGVKYAVAVSSGSTALMLAYMALGVGKGDEVIVPNRTWIATAHAAHLLGAKVVLVDVEKKRPIVDAERIEERITKRTKAIVPVHLNGRAANMKKINEIAKKHGIMVVEDAAQAFYSRNEQGFLGCQSTIGCFSLSVAKLISSGQGGFAVTNDPLLYEKMKLIRTHGVGDLIHVGYTQAGFNFRITDMQSAMAISVLKRLKRRVANVKEIYRRYYDGLRKLPFLRLIPVDLKAGEIPVYIEALCDDREAIEKYLAVRGVQTRPFYPDLDTAAYFKTSRHFPNSRPFGTSGLFLPSGPDQSPGDIEKVIKLLQWYPSGQ